MFLFWLARFTPRIKTSQSKGCRSWCYILARRGGSAELPRSTGSFLKGFGAGVTLSRRGKQTWAD